MNPCIVLRKQPKTLTFGEALDEARTRVQAGLGEHEVYELKTTVTPHFIGWDIGWDGAETPR